MRILVTGGAGFIGSHVVDALLGRGDEVVVVDDLSSGHLHNLEQHEGNARLQIVQADIAQGLLAISALSERSPIKEGVDGVVHLAAQVSVARSVEAPLEDLQTNALGLVQVLEYCRSLAKKPKVVYASSAAVYGDVQQVPTPEKAPQAPLSPYGINKYAGEHWLRFYSDAYGVPCSALRFFNVFGPRQDPSSAYSGVISIFIDRALANKDITIYGDGDQTRDFVYVGDVVCAILAALGLGRSTSPINVGTGRTTTVTQLAAATIQLAESSSQVSYGPARTGDIRHSSAIVTALQETLGVSADVSLSVGLQAILDSLQSGTAN